MADTLHRYVPLHFYCSIHTDSTLIYIYLKHLFSDTNSYSAIGINVRQINMAAKCKLTIAVTNAKMCKHFTCVNICVKYELTTTKLWPAKQPTNTYTDDNLQFYWQ